MTEVKVTPALRFPEFEGEWEIQPLEKLTRRIGDGIHTTPKYDDNGEYFFINGNNLLNGQIIISDSTKRVGESEFKIHSRNLGESTILMSINGTIGNLAFYNFEKVVLGKSAAYINLKKEVNKLFIYNYLQTAQAKRFYESELTGSTIKNLSLKTIKETKAPNPSPTEQQKIASFLSAVDNRIQLLKQKKEKLQAYKNGVLQQIFSQQIRFKDENGNDFPEWEEKKLGEVAKITTGSTPPTLNKEYYDGNYLFVSPADISESRFIFSTIKTLTVSGLKKGRPLKKGSVLFVSIGSTIGKVAQAGYDCISNQQINALEADSKNCNDFIYYLLLKEGAKIKLLAGVQAVPQINKTDFSNLRFKFPSLTEQQKIASFLTSLDKAIEAVQAQTNRSAEFKKGLLQQLFV